MIIRFTSYIEEGGREKQRGRRVCLGGKVCSISYPAGCFASVDLEEKDGFNLFFQIEGAHTCAMVACQSPQNLSANLTTLIPQFKKGFHHLLQGQTCFKTQITTQSQIFVKMADIQDIFVYLIPKNPLLSATFFSLHFFDQVLNFLGILLQKPICLIRQFMLLFLVNYLMRFLILVHQVHVYEEREYQMSSFSLAPV